MKRYAGHNNCFHVIRRGIGELTATEDNISDVLAFATEVPLILGELLETATKAVMRNTATQLISCDQSLCSNTAVKV
jgi:hypothetical protein